MTNNVGLILIKEPFQRELKRIDKNIRIMSVHEVSESGHTIKEHTYLKVPFDEGYLVEGFGQTLKTKSGSFYELEVYYSAKNNPFTEYDYAWIQEMKDYHHPKRGEQYYLGKGMKESEKEIFENIEGKFEKILMTGTYW